MVKYVTDFFLYRWRYVFGYTLVGVVLTELLIVGLLYVPGGLDAAEMSSTVTSNNFSLAAFNPSLIVNLPYHLVQNLSFALLGVSEFSIKLPSIIFGVLSIIGIIILLRTWFRENVAILTTVLVVTTSQFLFTAQNGTPDILYIFWPTWILVAAMMISRGTSMGWLWKVVLFGLGALSLYTPLSVYMLLALVSASLFHPHLRFIARRLPKGRLALAAVCALILLAPLIRSIIMDPSLIYTLLGIPHVMPDLMKNGERLLRDYFDFASPGNGLIMTPVYTLPAMLLIIMGVYRLITTKYTARSYIIVSWIILLIPTLLLNPMRLDVTFVPLMLLMAMGVYDLFRRWYRLFPRNPYARVAGLIPISVLMAIMVFSGVERFGYGYHYNPQVARYFSSDLRLLDSTIKKYPQNVTLIASDNEVAFYRAVADHQKKLAAAPVSTPRPSTPIVILTHDAHRELNYGIPEIIVTSSRSHDADRFYIYKSAQK